jgi:hypothetical protein
MSTSDTVVVYQLDSLFAIDLVYTAYQVTDITHVFTILNANISIDTVYFNDQAMTQMFYEDNQYVYQIVNSQTISTMTIQIQNVKLIIHY